MKMRLKTIEIEHIENTGTISIFYMNNFCGTVSEKQILDLAFNNLKIKIKRSEWNENNSNSNMFAVLDVSISTIRYWM